MKTCLVTGASGLIGSELVLEFIANGYKVFGLDLRPSKDFAHAAYKFIKTDISKEASIKAAFAKIKKLDVLINNGAVASPENGPVEELTLKKWEKVIRTNLTSVFLLSKFAIPKLNKSQGVILNVASTRRLMCEPETEIYSTAKGGVVAFTRALAVSLSGSVRVNSISPGWIADPAEELSAADHEQHPAGRVGRPSDIAKMALYLASEDSSFVTGADFIIDGGMTSKMIYI